MRKKIVATLLASLMVVSLAACGGGSGEAAGGDAKEEGAGAAVDENTLSVWTWDPNFNIYAMQVAEKLYAEDHEGFKLDITEIKSEDIEMKITTAVSAGDLSTLPDIFLMQDNSFQKFATNYPAVFTDLTDKGIKYDEFSQAKVAYSTLDGKNYGVPFDNGAVVNLMRTDILEQAGFTIEDFTDITWSDYMEKAKVVLEKTGIPMITSQAGSPDQIMFMLQSCGASLFDKDGKVIIEGNEPLKESMEIYAQMVKDGTLVEVTDWDQYVASLNNGTVCSTLNGCWIMASVTAKEDQSGLWGITNMPRLDKAEGATNYSNNGGSSWAITSNCHNVDLAVDFLSTMYGGNQAFYDDIIQKGALATWAPAAESEVYNQPVEFFGNDAIYAKIVDFSTKTPANITGAFYYDARNAVGEQLSNVTQTGMSIDDAIKAAQETADFAITQ